MTVQQLLYNTTSQELSEWNAFLKIRAGRSEYPKQKPEEIGERMRGLAKAMKMAQRGKKKKKKKRPKEITPLMIEHQQKGSPADGHDNR